MSNYITLYQQNTITGTIKNLPASKSISNRAIVINALAGNRGTLNNLSEANDTQLMRQLIGSENPVLNVEDAGTTMRFLTAYCAVTGKQKLITGTERMKKRPIGLLVDALRTLGASIKYHEDEGFPPLSVQGFQEQKTTKISIRGDVSSQYLSALMMIGPVLPSGLELNFVGNLTSKPYVSMTASLMKQFGAVCEFTEGGVIIQPKPYTPAQLTVETDWSAASYWFAFVALSKDSHLELPGMTLRSLQGDRVIVDIMELLGVKAEPRGNSLQLLKKDHRTDFSWNFKDCPDLAQTVAVVCAAKGIQAEFEGLESLRIKETDRIQALYQELQKLGATFTEHGSKWKLTPGIPRAQVPLVVNTFLDHRMAMAFAPLATCMTLSIENPVVVNKSYPKFWDDVVSVGIKVH